MCVLVCRGRSASLCAITHGASRIVLHLCGTQDPVRIYEKATDDYVHDFDDWDDTVIIPEACVVDVLRVRIVVQSAGQMLQLQAQLQEGFVLPGASGKPESRLRLIRAKNKFSTGTINDFMGLCELFLALSH